MMVDKLPKSTELTLNVNYEQNKNILILLMLLKKKRFRGTPFDFIIVWIVFEMKRCANVHGKLLSDVILI